LAVNFLAFVKGLLTAFHDVYNFSLNCFGIDAPSLNLNRLILITAGMNLFSIPQHREIRVVCRKNELRCQLHFPDEFDHVVINGLVVEIILRLVFNN